MQQTKTKLQSLKMKGYVTDVNNMLPAMISANEVLHCLDNAITVYLWNFFAATFSKSQDSHEQLEIAITYQV